MTLRIEGTGFKDGGFIVPSAIIDCNGCVGVTGVGGILCSQGNYIEWVAPPPAGIACSVLTAKGDIVVATAAETATALPVGADGQVLTACSACASGLTWVAGGGGGGSGTVTSITAGAGLTGGTITTSGTIALDSTCVLGPSDFTAKGDLLIGTGTSTYSALAVGANGTFLQACNTCTNGARWTTIVQGTGCISCTSLGAIGSIIVSTGPNTPGRLPIGAAGQVLTIDFACSATGYLKWAAPTAAAATSTTLGALYGCDQSASNSVYIGYGSGINGYSSTNNTALGADAMGVYSGSGGNIPTCVTGSIAIGQWALATSSVQTVACVTNTIAIGNRALGSGSQVAAGDGNLFIGHNTGINKGTGDNNVVVGNNAGSGTWQAGRGTNTFIGNNVNSTVVNGDNNTVIGYNASSVSGASNSVTLGNSSIGVLRAQVTTITGLSDARDKTNITALPVGLDFVNSLNPVKFTWQMREPNEVKDGTSEAGFIAQDLMAAQSAAQADYLGLVYDQDPDKLEASPGKLIPVLVNAIKELSAKNDELEERLKALESQG